MTTFRRSAVEIYLQERLDDTRREADEAHVRGELWRGLAYAFFGIGYGAGGNHGGATGMIVAMGFAAVPVEILMAVGTRLLRRWRRRHRNMLQTSSSSGELG